MDPNDIASLDKSRLYRDVAANLEKNPNVAIVDRLNTPYSCPLLRVMNGVFASGGRRSYLSFLLH